MEEIGVVFSFDIGGFTVEVTESLVVQWGVILLLAIGSY